MGWHRLEAGLGNVTMATSELELKATEQAGADRKREGGQVQKEFPKTSYFAPSGPG